MANSSATSPPFKSKGNTTNDFLAKAKALADEENVSLAQYVAGMLRHALRGDNLANVHFFQDSSGDPYNTDDLNRMHEEALADDVAGELKTFKNAEEGLAYLDEPEAAVDAGKEID
jgi:hypothetical protein